jgi:hypothetical protein|tara:strand:+ start:124 stop:387 length:264 start_codon:yes stop_codon:yes gene_type:complete
MERWRAEEQNKLITRIAICVVGLVVIFFLFSCNSSDTKVEPVVLNDTPYTTDSIDVIDNGKPAGLEESVPVIKETEPVIEDTTKVIQ